MSASSFKIFITPHAEEQIRNRKLTRERVMQVASSPEEIVTVSPNRYFAQSRFAEGGRTYLLRVLMEHVEDERWIVTVYPTSKVAKYWRGGR
jgi:hypothetical protein